MICILVLKTEDNYLCASKHLVKVVDGVDSFVKNACLC